MPAVLVIGTLVLICRKIIFRSLISKYKTEKPDSFDPESLSGVRLWESNFHHQYHDLRQRSNITGWHSDLQIPPPFHQPQHIPQHIPQHVPQQHQQHQQHTQQHSPPTHFASIPVSFAPPPVVPLYPVQPLHTSQYVPHQALPSVHVHVDNIAGCPAIGSTSGLPRPATGVKGKTVKAPSPVPAAVNKKSGPVAGSLALVSTSIDSADVPGRVYVAHKHHKQSTTEMVQAPPQHHNPSPNHNPNLPPLVVSSAFTPSVSPFCTQPSTAVHSPVFSPSESFYDEFNDPEDGLSQSMQTPTTQSSGDNRYPLKQNQASSDNEKSVATISRQLKKKNSAINFFSGDFENRGDSDNVQTICSKSADFLDVTTLQPTACRGNHIVSYYCLSIFHFYVQSHFSSQVVFMA